MIEMLIKPDYSLEGRERKLIHLDIDDWDAS